MSYTKGAWAIGGIILGVFVAELTGQASYVAWLGPDNVTNITIMGATAFLAAATGAIVGGGIAETAAIKGVERQEEIQKKKEAKELMVVFGRLTNILRLIFKTYEERESIQTNGIIGKKSLRDDFIGKYLIITGQELLRVEDPKLLFLERLTLTLDRVNPHANDMGSVKVKDYADAFEQIGIYETILSCDEANNPVQEIISDLRAVFEEE